MHSGTNQEAGEREREKGGSWNSYWYVLVHASAHLFAYMSACIYAHARRLPLLYLGQVSSSLSSITRGKWNKFVSDCSMQRGGR